MSNLKIYCLFGYCLFGGIFVLGGDSVYIESPLYCDVCRVCVIRGIMTFIAKQNKQSLSKDPGPDQSDTHFLLMGLPLASLLQ